MNKKFSRLPCVRFRSSANALSSQGLITATIGLSVASIKVMRESTFPAFTGIKGKRGTASSSTLGSVTRE